MVAVVVFLVSTLSYALLFQSTPLMDTPITFTIPEGASASKTVDALAAAGLTRSTLLLHATLVLFFDPGEIKAGTYVFTELPTTYGLAARITAEAPPGETVSVTLPEGYTAAEFGELAARSLPEFDQALFTELATPYEGFLFPDTYQLPPDFTEAELLTLLRETYDERTAELGPRFSNHQLSETGVIILASILEREANSLVSMQIVSGILQSRLALGMPLQADASIEYVLDKPLSELTPADLKIDNPYNTYRYQGLTPTPIGNPGLTSIQAVLEPAESAYLFYITGTDGEFYYAETYADHQRNIERYLR